MAQKPEQKKVAGEIPICCVPCAINATIDIYYTAKGYEHINGNEMIAGLAAILAKLVGGLENLETRDLLKDAFAGVFAKELAACLEHKQRAYSVHIEQ